MVSKKWFWSNIPPKGFLIVLSQVWQVHSYFGLRAIMVIFLTSSYVGYSDEKAFGTYLAMVALADVLSVVSGKIGDSNLGKLRAVMFGAGLLTVGFFLIGAPFSLPSFYLGVSCLSVGIPMYRPNCFSILGRLMREAGKDSANEDEKSVKSRVDSGMALVYALLSPGFIMAYSITGAAMEYKGWYSATSIISWSMVIAATFVGTYALSNNHHCSSIVREIFSLRSLKLSAILIPLIAVCAYFIVHESLASFSLAFGIVASLGYFFMLFLRMNGKQRRSITVFVLYLTLLLLFIMIERQIHTISPLFFSRNVDRTISGHTIPVTFIYLLIPMSNLCLGPINAHFLHKYKSKTLLPGLRIVMAFICIGICFAIMACGCQLCGDSGYTRLMWPMLSVVFFALGDSMFIPSMLSMASRLAPKDMGGTFLGMVFVWVAMGTMLAKPLAKMVVIPNNQVINPLESIVIYRNGFIRLAIMALCLTVFATMIKILCDRMMRRGDVE